MSIIDIIIILFILLGAVVGYRQGFTKSLVSLCGFLIIIVLAFLLKNPISALMVTHLPFFDFWGLIKGVSVMNIVFYEMVAFLLVLGILSLALKLLSVTTSIFERLLSMTIILGIPSKILGTILGTVKSYIIVFVVLYILALPMFSEANFIKNSSLQKPILEHTPILSAFADETLGVMNEFSSLADKYQSNNSSNQFNYETLDLLLNYEVVKPETVQILIDKDKLHIKGAQQLLNKYKED